MSEFDLVPVDGGGSGNPIHLPPGETVLGRGPLLGVSDKRVSRHHGLLENLDGQLRLKPTHLNPCFVQSSLSAEPQPLQRNTWHPLHHGDFISLLPGQFVYKVVAVGGEEGTLRNSQMFEEEEEERPVSPEPHVEPPPPPPAPPPQEEVTPAAPSSPEEADGSLNKKDSTQPKEDQTDVPLSATQRRVLPAWMMTAVAATHTPSSPSCSPKAAVKRSKGTSTSMKGAAVKQATPTKTSSPEEEEELSEEEERPKKRRRRTSSDEEEEAKADVPPEPSKRLQSESKRSEVSDESKGFTMEVDEEDTGGETSAVDRNSEDRDSGTNGRQQTKQVAVESNGGSASRPRLRAPCPYGKSCYRKNPVHFQECSHPGDTDYKEEEEEEEEDRPECPYGTDCYRKNPLHRKEYRHTKKPARATRTVPKTTDDDEDEDDEDDIDSFINDDSEDAGDDSDYEPPVSDDSGKEDIIGLQREAKAFMKRRK